MADDSEVGGAPTVTDDQDEALGEKTGATLLSMFQDTYRQEVAAEEDVHRTLPFFATALGVIVAALNYAAGQMPGWAAMLCGCTVTAGATQPWGAAGCTWPVVLAGMLLTGAALLCVGVLGLLALATRRQEYRRVGPESVHVMRAHQLRDYHRSAGLSGTELDLAVALDLREQMLEDYAAVIPANRALTLRRYGCARGRCRA